MKLRNKRTGDIWEFDGGFSMKASRETTEKAGGRGCSLTCYAHSLAELNAEWEDAQPAEPLIKDEKIRKAVRAWAEANYIEKDGYNNCKVEFDGGEHRLKWIETSIEFNEITGLENLEDGEVYTIAELCGEEEEPRPVIANGVEYDSYADYIKSREEEE